MDLPIKDGNFPVRYVKVYQRVNLHFPMVFLWFSYGFPMVLTVPDSSILPSAAFPKRASESPASATGVSESLPRRENGEIRRDTMRYYEIL